MTGDHPITRGDLWLVDIGSDPSDPETAFRGPAAIVSDDRLHHPNLNMSIVIPGTSTLCSLPFHVEVEPSVDNGLTDTTAFQVEQVRAASVRRFVGILGHLGPEEMQDIDTVLRMVLHV